MLNMFAASNFDLRLKRTLWLVLVEDRRLHKPCNSGANIQDSNKRRFRDRFNKELEQGQKLTSAKHKQKRPMTPLLKRETRQAIIGAVTGTAMGAIGTPRCLSLVISSRVFLGR